MITHVKASADIGKEPLSFQSVVAAGVPLDKEAPEIIFSVLDSEKGEVVDGSEEHGHLVRFGKDPFMVRALGLNNCAAVCFVNREYSDDLKGYVYHALGGTLRQNAFEKIMKEIEVTRVPGVSFAMNQSVQVGY